MTESPTIRRASAADAATITAITDEAYAKYIPQIGRKPQPMTADYSQLLEQNDIWLLCLGDQPAGVLVLEREPAALLIYSIAIRPVYQQRGFGRQLLGWAESEARQAGYAQIRLYTNAVMEQNIALYRRVGYHETGREAYLGGTVVHLAKQLV